MNTTNDIGHIPITIVMLLMKIYCTNYNSFVCSSIVIDSDQQVGVYKQKCGEHVVIYVRLGN